METNVIIADASDPGGFDRLMRLVSGFDAVVLLGGPALFLSLVALVFLMLVRRKRKAEAIELNQAGVLSQEPVSPSASAQTSVNPEPIHPTISEGSIELVETLKTESKSWLDVLKSGMARTRQAVGASLAGLFSGSTRLDAALLEKIHETLYRADLGVKATDKLVTSIRNHFSDQEAPSWADIQQHLVAEISAIFRANDREVKSPASPPWVILVVGVNGVGKTTTIGKLSARFMAEGKSVLLGAADTFRAAAIEQLEVWGKRLQVDVIRQQQGSDPAAVAYDAAKAAVARGKDILIIDTAGRLHNKTELMDELGKIHRVLGRDIPGAPHETWLVIDATTGQNASTQVKAFKEVANVTGLIVTKLDGTAKGGVLIGIAEQFGVPIRYIGVGEKASDLQPFQADEFAKALF